jgi:hypothetical protein
MLVIKSSLCHMELTQIILSVLLFCVQVEAVPTVLAMKDGKIIDKFVGLKDDAALQTFVEKLIGGK